MINASGFPGRYGIDDDLDQERLDLSSFFDEHDRVHELGFVMSDHATPNLPSRNFDATATFYERLGFQVAYRDRGWMILHRAAMTLEFFPHPDLDPLANWFSCCLRLDDLDDFYAQCKAAGVPEACKGHPRLHPPQRQEWGGRLAALVDPDGTLVRLIQNEPE